MTCFVFWALPSSLDEVFICFTFCYFCYLLCLGICSSGYCCIPASLAMLDPVVEAVQLSLSSFGVGWA